MNEESYAVQYAKHRNILYIVPNIPYIVKNNIQYIVQNIPYIVHDTIQISSYEKPCTVLQYSKSRNGVTDVDFDTHYGVSDKSSHDSSNNVREINTVTKTDNNVPPYLLYNADNNVRPNLLYNVNAIQQDDFVCDNNQYYLNNNNCDPVSNNDNANSIQAIVDTIIEVKMNGMFYIPAKKKYILYILIPKKKRSF